MIFLDKAAMRFENGNNTISDTKLKIVFAFAIRRLGYCGRAVAAGIEYRRI